MFLTRIRSKLSGSRDSVFVIAALLLVGLVVIVAHSEPSAHGMEGDDSGMAGAMSICLAVLQIGAAALVVHLVRSRFQRSRPPRTIEAKAVAYVLRRVSEPGHRIREGPAVLQVFRH